MKIAIAVSSEPVQQHQRGAAQTPVLLTRRLSRIHTNPSRSHLDLVKDTETSHNTPLSAKSANRMSVQRTRDMEFITQECMDQGHSVIPSPLTEPLLASKLAKKVCSEAEAILIVAHMPGFHTGVMIASALQFQKPVVVLFRDGVVDIPEQLFGQGHELLQMLSYSTDSLKKVMSTALDYARDAADVRFNFFISPTINRYLDWIAKERKIPRSVFLRSLIEDSMNRDSEYAGRM